MKLTLLFTTACLLLLFTACQNDSSDDNNNNGNNTSLTGSWVITNFSEDGVNETAKFNGYTFTFNNDNSLDAIKSGSTAKGTWSLGNDDSSDKFIINFNTGKPLEELSEDWVILEQTSKLLRLRHVSGGNGGIDEVTFEVK